MGFWPVVLNVLRNSDIVLLVLDARMPSIAANSEIIKKTEKMNKEIVFVFNKIDLIKSSDIKAIEKNYPDAFFVSALKRRGITKLKKKLDEKAKLWRRESLRVGIVGYPNAGKSSLINAMVPNARVKVKSISGTTRKTEWIRAGKIRIMDSPGVIPAQDNKIKIGLTASKDPHKIRNPEKVAIKILEFLTKKDVTILKRFYKLKLEKNLDVYDIFLEIGRKKGFLVKGGVVDENRTAIKIIDDWQRGRIGLK